MAEDTPSCTPGLVHLQAGPDWPLRASLPDSTPPCSLPTSMFYYTSFWTPTIPSSTSYYTYTAPPFGLSSTWLWSGSTKSLAARLSLELRLLSLPVMRQRGVLHTCCIEQAALQLQWPYLFSEPAYKAVDQWCFVWNPIQRTFDIKKEDMKKMNTV